MMAILAAGVGLIALFIAWLIVQIGFIFAGAVLSIVIAAVIGIALGIWVCLVRMFYVQRQPQGRF